MKRFREHDDQNVQHTVQSHSVHFPPSFNGECPSKRLCQIRLQGSCEIPNISSRSVSMKHEWNEAMDAQENVQPQMQESMEVDQTIAWNNRKTNKLEPVSPKRCLRCLSGEPGHIKHILG